jgi:hypothetical protein
MLGVGVPRLARWLSPALGPKPATLAAWLLSGLFTAAVLLAMYLSARRFHEARAHRSAEQALQPDAHESD